MAELSTLARPYARAAFQFALSNDQLSVWHQQLALLAAVVQHEKVVAGIESPALSASHQATIIIDVCGDELNEPVGNFVKLLAQNKRLPLLPGIVRQFAQFKTEHEKAVDVELITAIALDSEAQEKLAASLATKLARKINIHTQIDPSLLGGAVLKYGDMVIDGSLRGRLDKLSRAINS
ncbi:MAG: F0F1 ATP synthase subunit delta [Puniceicoccaceae bacterium]|nr:MAG: F0F1 ATP synthase subunit delta [Puniceicoccaceae bacterium]